MDPSTPSTTTNPCAITGQPDIYGLGIRISLYLQWYTGVLAYVYSRSEAHLPITTNYLLAIAVGVACMVHYDDIYSLEVMIVAILVMVPPLALLMVLGEFLLFVWEEWGSDMLEHTVEGPVARAEGTVEELVTKAGDTVTSVEGPATNVGNPATNVEGPATDVGGSAAKVKYPVIEFIAHFGVLLGTAFLLGVMVWGFFYGPDIMKKAEGCTPMFAGSRYLEGSYAVGLKIWSVALIVFAITTILFFMGYRWREYSNDTDKYTKLVAKFVAIEHSNSPLNTSYSWLRPLAVVFCGGVVSTCVMTIELVIYQNDIQGVGVDELTSAGQLIPLTIALASFVLMIFEAYRSAKVSRSKGEGSGTRVQVYPVVHAQAAGNGAP